MDSKPLTLFDKRGFVVPTKEENQRINAFLTSLGIDPAQYELEGVNEEFFLGGDDHGED